MKYCKKNISTDNNSVWNSTGPKVDARSPTSAVISFKALIFDLYLQLVSKKFNEIYYIRNDFLVNDNTMAVDRFHPSSVYYKSWALKISETIIKKYNGG